MERHTHHGEATKGVGVHAVLHSHHHLHLVVVPGAAIEVHGGHVAFRRVLLISAFVVLSGLGNLFSGAGSIFRDLGNW